MIALLLFHPDCHAFLLLLLLSLLAAVLVVDSRSWSLAVFALQATAIAATATATLMCHSCARQVPCMHFPLECSHFSGKGRCVSIATIVICRGGLHVAVYVVSCTWRLCCRVVVVVPQSQCQQHMPDTLFHDSFMVLTRSRSRLSALSKVRAAER